MLKVTVDLHRFGIGAPQTLCTLIITNDGTGTREIGNYHYHCDNPLCDGEVRGFRRLECSPWELVYLVLRDMFDNST